MNPIINKKKLLFSGGGGGGYGGGYSAPATVKVIKVCINHLDKNSINIKINVNLSIKMNDYLFCSLRRET